MCEYCNLVSGETKNIIDDDDDILVMERHNNTFDLLVNGTLDFASTNINYCPFCGRKLGE